MKKKYKDDNIIKLISKGKFMDILHIIGKDNINNPLYNKNYMIHYIGYSNNIKLLKHVFDLKVDIKKQNSELKTVGHIVAELGYGDFLIKLVEYDPLILNIQDIDGSTILHIIAKNSILFSKVINICQDFVRNKKININKTDRRYCSNCTILIYLILLYAECEKDSEKKEIFNNIKLLLDLNIDVNYGIIMSPLSVSVKSNSIDIVKLLLEHKNIDVNKLDVNGLSPLGYSIIKNIKITKLLLEKGANYNIQTYDTFPAHFPLVDSILFQNIEATRLLLKYDIDFSFTNSFLDTIGHVIFSSNNNYPTDIKRDILERTIDINQKNVDGNTVLHLLLKNYEWIDYEDILKKKLLDIFTKNKNGDIPFDYIRQKNIERFINVVADGYLYFLDNNDISGYKISKKLLKCNNDMKDKHDKNKCIKIITKELKNNKKLINVENGDNIIDINKNGYAKYVLYIGNTVRLHMKIINMLKKYKNLGIPYSNKNIVNESKIHESIDKINNTIKYIPELYYFELIWIDRQLIVPEKFNEAFDDSIKKNKYDYIFISIFLKLSIHKTAHQNILIYDVKNNTLERFNSMGDIDELYDYESLDKKIFELFSKMKSINVKKFKYIKSINNFREGPQVLSHEKDVVGNIKIADPGGFCLTWAFWYLEMRMVNENILPPKLIIKANNKILNSDYTFTEYIRNYTKKISDKQNKLLHKIGIDDKHLYDIHFDKTNLVEIYKYLRKSLKRILK